jgi:hypothetical protein
VFNDSAFVVEPEDVHSGIVEIARPSLAAVQHHMVPVCEGPDNVDVLTGIVGGHPLEILNECLLSITDVGIVLDVDLAGELLDCLSRLALIEHEIVEGDDSRLVPLECLVTVTTTMSPAFAASTLVAADARGLKFAAPDPRPGLRAFRDRASY